MAITFFGVPVNTKSLSWYIERCRLRTLCASNIVVSNFTAIIGIKCDHFPSPFPLKVAGYHGKSIPIGASFALKIDIEIFPRWNINSFSHRWDLTQMPWFNVHAYLNSYYIYMGDVIILINWWLRWEIDVSRI